MTINVKLTDTVLAFDCTGDYDDMSINGCIMCCDDIDDNDIELPDDLAMVLAEQYFDIISDKYGTALKEREMDRSDE